MFEKVARVSLVGSIAPTVMAATTRAGDALQASALELPAAITKVTPAAIALPTDVGCREKVKIHACLALGK